VGALIRAPGWLGKRAAAHQLPRSLRAAFLQRLAAQLDGRDFGDGELHRVAHAIVRER